MRAVMIRERWDGGNVILFLVFFSVFKIPHNAHALHLKEQNLF